jgi:hypothetical protein
MRSYIWIMKHMYCLFALLLFTACGDGKADAAKAYEDGQNEVKEQPGKVLDLSPFDMPLMVELPTTPVNGDQGESEPEWNEEFGHLRISCGEGFGITITEDAGDIQRLKADLDRDMLRKHTIIGEEDGLVIYRLQFPDEEIVFVHFYQVVRSGARTFVVESMSGRRFNEAEVNRMTKAVHPATVL